MVTGHRILLVDDERLILELMKEFLELQGFEVDAASELEEAEAMIATYPYDTVVTDLRLSGYDSSEGLELVRFVRQKSPDALVVLLTGSNSLWSCHESERRGADIVLRKPLPLTELARVVRDLAGGRPAAQRRGAASGVEAVVRGAAA